MRSLKCVLLFKNESLALNGLSGTLCIINWTTCLNFDLVGSILKKNYLLNNLM